MSQMQSAFELLDGDVNGYGMKRIKESLFELRSTVKKSMDSGLDPESFAQAQRVYASIEAAETAVDKLHKKMVG